MKNKKFLSSLIFILLLALFIFSAIQGYSDLKSRSKDYHANTLDIIDQRMKSLIFEINSFPGSAGSEVLFLSKLSSIGGVASFIEAGFRKQTIEDIEKDFLLFLKENSAYYQLRYIDETGMEVIRAAFEGEEYKIIPEQNLQDKSSGYYFQEAMKLKEREIFVSPLDLNMENREIENRGTEGNPAYVPVIRYAAPVFDDEGTRKGILISNIYADYFLEDIRRAQRDGEDVFLINNDGYYLAHPDINKEYAFMFDEKDDNFYRDYPWISEEVLSDFSKRRFETDELIFTFRSVYPTATSFEVYKGSDQIFGENSEEAYYWILISVSDKKIIENQVGKMRKNYIYSLLFSGLIILVIFILIVGMNFKRKSESTAWSTRKARSSGTR